jgi:Prokaryotic metallothionein
MADESCAHPDCDCEIEAGAGVSKDGKNYCSEFCAASEGASIEDCECGHSDCE